MNLKLIDRKLITANIVLESGLHIGAGKDAIEIGGIDNPILKHPLTDEPYIPGSSIKGKLRSLLEWRTESVQDDVTCGATGRSTTRPAIASCAFLAPPTRTGKAGRRA